MIIINHLKGCIGILQYCYYNIYLIPHLVYRVDNYYFSRPIIRIFVNFRHPSSYNASQSLPPLITPNACVRPNDIIPCVSLFRILILRNLIISLSDLFFYMRVVIRFLISLIMARFYFP